MDSVSGNIWDLYDRTVRYGSEKEKSNDGHDEGKSDLAFAAFCHAAFSWKSASAVL